MYQILYLPNCCYVESVFDFPLNSEEIFELEKQHISNLFVPSLDDHENMTPVRVFESLNKDWAIDLLCSNIDDLNNNGNHVKEITIEEFEIVWVD